MFNKEDALIPFNTSPLPSGPWLVFAPHADDETFGMGGTLIKRKNDSNSSRSFDRWFQRWRFKRPGTDQNFRSQESSKITWN